MNLHAVVTPSINAVNPGVAVLVKRASGYTTADDGTQVPQYTDLGPVMAQVQALGYQDLMKMDGMNIQGVRRGVYLNGAIAGVIRSQQKGGDILVFPAGTLPEGDTWLCAQALEQWPDWCKVVITLQNQ